MMPARAASRLVVLPFCALLAAATALEAPAEASAQASSTEAAWAALQGNEEGRQRIPAARFASIHLRVDIPYPDGMSYSETSRLLVPPGATVVDAVSAVYRVDLGFVCFGPDDIYALNGVAYDARDGTAWTVEVNGNTRNVSSRTRLSDGDRVVLRYGRYSDAPHEAVI